MTSNLTACILFEAHKRALHKMNVTKRKFQKYVENAEAPNFIALQKV
jgi:hypothetical protein